MVKKTPPQDIVNLMNSAGSKIIDIRNATKFASGHILNAENISLNKVCDFLLKSKKYTKKHIVFVCNDGATINNKILTKLRESGVDKLYILKGGMVAWEKDGMPVVRK